MTTDKRFLAGLLICVLTLGIGVEVLAVSVSSGSESATSNSSTLLVSSTEDSSSTIPSSSSSSSHSDVDVLSRSSSSSTEPASLLSDVVVSSTTDSTPSSLTSSLSEEQEEETETESANTSRPIYRLYHPVMGEHLYTPDENEKNILYQHGWGYEGVGWYAPNKGKAVYRLYNAGLQHHLYTTDTNEVAVLTSLHGWTKDNQGRPMFYSGGPVSIYRLYNPGLRGLHHWTTDAHEYRVLPQHGWHQEGTQISAARFGSPTPYTMYAADEAIGAQIRTSGNYRLHPMVRQQLISAIKSFRHQGYNIGFMMMDVHTKKAIEYNADTHFYSASTVKGPFIASLAAKKPWLIQSERATMLSVLHYSSNEGYRRLVNTYSFSSLDEWAREAGVRTSITRDLYPYYSTRELFKLWHRNYTYFTDDWTGQQVGLWFENPNYSPIKAVLGNQYRVRSKAGWIGEVGYHSASDAGIVYAPTGPYIVAIMTDADAKLPMLNSTVQALNSLVGTIREIQKEMAVDK